MLVPVSKIGHIVLKSEAQRGLVSEARCLLREEEAAGSSPATPTQSRRSAL